MSIYPDLDHFALFGLEPRFGLDPAALERAYRALQSQVHPDRYADRGAQEQRQSLQWATQVNEAWQTLRQPLSRARYLLKMHGVDTAEDSNTAMPVDFLMAQMERREAVAEARQARDVPALEVQAKVLAGESRALERTLAHLLDDEQAWQAAATQVRKMRFLQKLDQEIGDAIDDLLT